MSRRHHGRFDSIDFHDISPRRQPTGPKEAGTAAASKTSGSDSDTAAGIGIGPASLPGPGRLLGLLKLNCLLGCVGAVTGLLSTIINMSIFILAGDTLPAFFAHILLSRTLCSDSGLSGEAISYLPAGINGIGLDLPRTGCRSVQTFCGYRYRYTLSAYMRD